MTVEKSFTSVKADVKSVKTDVMSVKADVTSVKTDVMSVKADVKDFERLDATATPLPSPVARLVSRQATPAFAPALRRSIAREPYGSQATRFRPAGGEGRGAEIRCPSTDRKGDVPN